MDEQDVKIAVLEREVAGLREQHKEHKIEMVNSIKELSNEFFDAITGLRGDIKYIYEFINKSKGYFFAMMIVCSVIGGSIAAIFPIIVTHFWK